MHAAILLAAGFLAACDRPPSVELKEWSPADHDGEKKVVTASASGAAPAARQGARTDAGASATLIEATWRNQCATCHGAQGRGDGPQGPMFRAPDLGREDWQARIKNEEIAATITNGKGRMPKFELPEEIVGGLVARVRSFRVR